MEKVQKMVAIVESRKERSAWGKGVKLYALELLEYLETGIEENWIDPEVALSTGGLLLKSLLNGATDWETYSEGGCALVYNKDIAERLCTVTELKKTANGLKAPNKVESWIDVQTRALIQAWNMIWIAWKEA